MIRLVDQSGDVLLEMTEDEWLDVLVDLGAAEAWFQLEEGSAALKSALRGI